MVSSAGPEVERFEFSYRLIRPHIPSLTQAIKASSTTFSQDTDSHLCSSTQEHFFAPHPISPSNSLTTPVLPNDTSESLIPGRSTYYHDVQLSLFLLKNPFPCTSASTEQYHRQNSVEAAFIGFTAHLEKAQVLQSLSIVQDYLTKHPSIFETQAAETVQRWMVDIQSEELTVPLPE